MKISETERAAMSALGASLNQTDDVLAELDAANQRLAEAERLLRECDLLLHLMAALNHRPEGGDTLRDAIKSWLTPTPAQASEPSYQAKTPLGKKLMALREQAVAKGMPLMTADEILNREQATEPEYVLVPKADLELFLTDWLREDCHYRPEVFHAYDRLKAALGKEGVEVK